MRVESSDYRYFSEPDLVPLSVGGEEVEALRAGLPELPAETRARFAATGVEAVAARVLVATGLGPLQDDAVAADAPPAEAAKWLTGEVTAHLNREGIQAGDVVLGGPDLAELIAMVASGDLSATAAKQVLDGVLAGEGSPRTVAETRDLIQIRDEGALGAAVAAVVEEHPDEMARIVAGDAKLVGFLVGRVMQATGGKADPRRVSELIQEHAAG